MIGHDHFICHSYCHFSVLSHILLSDKTLHLIATQQPTTIEAFGNINGIGEYKKEKYGKDFIELIKKVLQE